MSYCACIFFSDVFVGLQAVRYSVEEGNSVMVCAELVGQIEITVEVTISTATNGLAEGTKYANTSPHMYTHGSSQLVVTIQH